MQLSSINWKDPITFADFKKVVDDYPIQPSSVTADQERVYEQVNAALAAAANDSRLQAVPVSITVKGGYENMAGSSPRRSTSTASTGSTGSTSTARVVMTRTATPPCSAGTRSSGRSLDRIGEGARGERVMAEEGLPQWPGCRRGRVIL